MSQMRGPHAVSNRSHGTVGRQPAQAAPAASLAPAPDPGGLEERSRRASLLGHSPETFAIHAAPEGVQRKTMKDGDIRHWVRWATKHAQPNRQALLLVIYNQIRLEIPEDVRPAAFVALNVARQTLITANKLDAEDADLLDTEATRMQTAGGDHAEASRLRIVAEILAKRGGIEATYGNHVFQGDFNADHVPTGFHSKADGSATHETYGARTLVENRNGNQVQAYQQSVREIAAPGNQKPVQSTFFPDEATHDDVIDAITSVLGVGLTQVGYVNARVNGLKLRKKGDTVFPAGGSDTRLAE
jgi:hypothetical protein